jgi:hypothetical protein
MTRYTMSFDTPTFTTDDVMIRAKKMGWTNIIITTSKLDKKGTQATKKYIIDESQIKKAIVSDPNEENYELYLQSLKDDIRPIEGNIFDEIDEIELWEDED